MSIITIFIGVLLFLLCYNPTETLSQSPYDSHNIKTKSDGCITFAMPGHGQRGSTSKFRKKNKTLFRYVWKAGLDKGDRIENVLWYRDSACLYIQTLFYPVKETIYYDTYSRKREEILCETGNKEINEYFAKKLIGKWTSALDTIEVNTTNIIILKNGQKEILNWFFPKSGSSFLISYNDLSFFSPKNSYRNIVYISDTELKLHIRDFNTDKKEIVLYKKVL